MWTWNVSEESENSLNNFDYVDVLDDFIISAKSNSKHSKRVDCIMK